MLPVEEVLPSLLEALEARGAAVLAAPPGAGKSTIAPLRCLSAPWMAGRRILMLEPRRLAARAVAARLASNLGEPVGATVGYRVRMESRVSAATRLEVVTEGVFSRMILDDPGLDGVGLVIFDEFHERSLDADLGLALAHDCRRVLRPDLRLLVMSATLDVAAVSGLLDGAPAISSEGRAWPVETRYLGRDPGAPLEDQAVRAVRRALAETPGGVLVFLPGQAEIRRTAERLAAAGLPANVDVAPLFGALDPAAQDRAIAPAPEGRRKVVLATDIAETSLTLEGIACVVDAGLVRSPRFDPASGLTRLVTLRASRAAADQRRGRAGRTGPGTCYRLWDEAETRSLPAFATPEILNADLSGLALDLARWGVKDAAGLAFLDPPPAGALAEARSLLARLEVLDGQGVLTAHGEALSRLPLPPCLAHMVLAAAARGQAERAARIAVLASEPGLGGREVDLRLRLEALERDRGQRARDARALAGRWAAQAAREAGRAQGEPLDDGLLMALAWPERVARARGPAGHFQLAGGRGVWLEETDPLARDSWLAVGELGGGGRADRILMAAPVQPADLERLFAAAIVREARIEPGPSGRLRAVRIERIGRLVLREMLDEAPSADLIRAALLDQVRADGIAGLPWGEAGRALRARADFLRGLGEADAPDLGDAALLEDLDAWLGPALAGLRSLSDLSPARLEGALAAHLGHAAQRRLDALAPARWTAPTGNSFAIDYAAPGGPRVEVRVQEVFGLSTHPAVAQGRAPLTLALTSPAHRPIQTTRDLPGFWRGSWREVRAEMRGRYPRHVWPEDPASATPTARAKPRGT
ncbi:MAG: ATP-dependent helicase HrpB [Phenylobacterium sp.]|uniref:ATP-dependent helicase HrpB n=2 Tax=Phenylobacterium sp. TaxID=1871053 RepID=UPI0025DAE07A|nr:ATP-dependent helicase HrpB [Phenylobacterium sp.]MCA6235766.1 ATP-dependent helicase HrpB [Phenylobacterium sp.]MCA6265034.1 ATP-dependent helicase HrpB [Phenylobacterium sp.]